EALELGVRGSEFEPTRAEVVYVSAAGEGRLDSRHLGGALGGLLHFRGEILDPTRQSLGETALALAVRFHEQHASGMDLAGSMGGEFFSVTEPAVLHSHHNTGTGTASAIVSDIGAVTGRDYVLEFDGANYALFDAATREPVAMSGSGTGADPF